jgi:toxin ParE1/3/4
MASLRLSEAAKVDIATILKTSAERHGVDARSRYRGLLAAALRRIARAPTGLSTVARGELQEGVRSFHIRHSRLESSEAPVAAPVHVIFYRTAPTGEVEVIRVLHERMEPSRRVGGGADRV